MGLLQLPKYYHPDFAFPFVRPLGNVVIDRSAPESHYLTFAWQAHGRQTRDIVSGGVPTLEGTPSFNGRDVVFDGSGDKLVFGNTGEVISTTEPFCIIAETNLADFSSSFNAVLSIQSNGHAFTIGYSNNGSYDDIYFGSSSTWMQGASEHPKSVVGRIRLAVIYNGQGSGSVGNFRVFVNEVESATITSSTFTGITNETAIGGNTDAGQDFDGGVSWAYIYRGIPEALAETIIHRPHNVLKPAVPITYFLPSAGGASTLTADSGSYTYTGANADLQRGLIISADSGSYSYTGTNVDLLNGVNLPADSGAYTYTGTAATLTFSPVGDFTLTADSGAYSYTGTNVELQRGLSLAADSGAYTYAGTDAALLRGLILASDSGAYSYTGTNADLNPGFSLTADSGSYAYTGTNASLLLDRVLNAQSGSYTYNGATVSISSSGRVEFGRVMIAAYQDRLMVTPFPERKMIIN